MATKRKTSKTTQHVTFAVDCGDHYKVASTRNPKKVKIVAKPVATAIDSRALLPSVEM